MQASNAACRLCRDSDAAGGAQAPLPDKLPTCPGSRTDIVLSQCEVYCMPPEVAHLTVHGRELGDPSGRWTQWERGTTCRAAAGPPPGPAPGPRSAVDQTPAHRGFSFFGGRLSRTRAGDTGAHTALVSSLPDSPCSRRHTSQPNPTRPRQSGRGSRATFPASVG